MSDADRDAAPPSAAARLLADAAAVEADPRASSVPSQLTDYERTAIVRMATALVDAVGARLALSLGRDLPESFVDRARPAVLRDPAVVALLLRRAAEHRLRLHRDPSPSALTTFARDDDKDVANTAAALLTADEARFDRFHDPLVPLRDLPGAVRQSVVWSVAAALRASLPTSSAVQTDRILTRGVAALPGDGAPIDTRALAFAHALAAVDRLNDRTVVMLAEAGDITAAVGVLAERAVMAVDGAWAMALDPRGARLALLMRAGSVGGSAMAAVLRAWLPHASSGLATAAAVLPQAEAHAATRLWRLDPAYRAALVRIAQ